MYGHESSCININVHIIGVHLFRIFLIFHSLPPSPRLTALRNCLLLCIEFRLCVRFTLSFGVFFRVESPRLPGSETQTVERKRDNGLAGEESEGKSLMRGNVRRERRQIGTGGERERPPTE